MIAGLTVGAAFTNTPADALTSLPSRHICACIVSDIGEIVRRWAVQVEEELAALGVAAEAVAGIVAATQAASLPELEALLGHGHEVCFCPPIYTYTR